MSRKYLGTEFDIHGGGLDLMFPHHECEIAQSQASHNRTPEARIWMHNNMVTVNGAKMSKSLGNFITLPDLFAGTTTTLSQAYSPMVVRFFLLQAHYRSPIDLSDDALQAARKGYRKLMNGLRLVDKLIVSSSVPVANEEPANEAQPATNQHSTTDSDLAKLTADLFVGLDDDLNTARSVASLFNLLRKFNTLATTQAALADVSAATLTQAVAAYRTVVTDILGLQDEPRANAEQLLALTLSFYAEAKADKAYDKVDLIRAALKGQGIVIKDTKAGVEWAYSEE
jgi:cysteinyl-tRNA synthetase